jgi:uncharacterized protein YutE (UPF0331/DUF86 family)
MSTQQTESDVVRALVPELKAEGYEVYLHPNRILLPQSFGDFTPDILAIRGDEHMIVEVKLRSSRSDDQLRRIADLVRSQPGWTLRTVFVSPIPDADTLTLESQEAINQRISEARSLTEQDFLNPALLIAWAAFEAIARASSEKEFARPQTPGRIVERLASYGTVTPSEADLLRKLATKRNKLIHGDFSLPPERKELTNFVNVLTQLAKDVRHLPMSQI